MLTSVSGSSKALEPLETVKKFRNPHTYFAHSEEQLQRGKYVFNNENISIFLVLLQANSFWQYQIHTSLEGRILIASNAIMYE